MTLPLWGIALLILAVAIATKAVRVWLVAVALIGGLYLASTPAGQSVIHQIDHATHQSPTPATTRSTR